MEKTIYGEFDPPRISEIEMRHLIFQALSEELPENTPRQDTFKAHHYKGTIDDLHAIVEFLAIQKTLIPQIVEIKKKAWGCSGEILHYIDSTNFNQPEQDLFHEEFYSLSFHNVVSAGSSNGFDLFPNFHVTSFGLKCLAEGKNEVLPFDRDNYLLKIKSYHSDDWEEFYITEALRCYNCGAYYAAVTMLGICGEYIAEQLIHAMSDFLNRNDAALLSTFQRNLSGKRTISTRYAEYETIQEQVDHQTDSNGTPRYPSLNALSEKFDKSARRVYFTFVRLTRNNAVHPSDLKMNRTDTFMLFVSFIHYFKLQHQYLSELKLLS